MRKMGQGRWEVGSATAPDDAFISVLANIVYTVIRSAGVVVDLDDPYIAYDGLGDDDGVLLYRAIGSGGNFWSVTATRCGMIQVALCAYTYDVKNSSVEYCFIDPCCFDDAACELRRIMKVLEDG